MADNQLSQDHGVAVEGVLAEHSLVLCVERRERALALEALFKQHGIIVHLATTVYDCLRLAEQELPHLIITEPNLSDGTASNLLDRIKSHRQLQRIPVALMVTKLSKEEAAALVKRSLAGLFPATMDRRQIVEKTQKIMQSVANVSGSPHFVSWEAGGQDQEVGFFAESMFLGKMGNFAVCRSSSAVGTTDAVRCILKPLPEVPVALTATMNVSRNDGVLTLFPLHRIHGQGRSVLNQLPDLASQNMQGAGKAGSKVPRIVLAVGDAEGELLEWQKTLSAYSWQMHCAKDGAAAAALLAKAKVAAIWIHCDSAGKCEVPPELGATMATLPVQSRPLILMTVNKSGLISKDQICYLRPGFGLGHLLDALESSLCRPADLGDDAAISGVSGLAAQWAGNGRILGCDERSWYLRSSTAMAKGTRVSLHQSGNHPGHDAFWASLNLTVGTSVLAANGEYLLRLDVVAAGASKLRYWEKLVRDLNLA